MLAYARNEINRTRTTLSKTKPSSEQPRESARGSQPSRTPSPEGVQGSGAPHARFVENQHFHQNNSGRAREGRNPLAPPSPEGVQGSRAPHARFVGNNAHKRPACFVGNQHLHQNSPGRAREGRNPLASRPPRGRRGAERPTPASSETKSFKRIACFVGNQFLHQNSPGRAREGRNPLAPRPPRWGCRGAERPTPASSETKSFKRIACFVGNQFLHQNSPWESSRGCEPSRLPIEAGDLRGGKVACPKGKQVASRPTRRNRRFRLVAPGR